MRDQGAVIIDGYNLIHRVPALAARLTGPDGLNAARSYLLGGLRAYQSRRNRRVVLVLDGPRGGRSDFGPVEVLYAASADDAVVAQSGPGCLVVTSDSAVRQAVIARGAEVLSSEDFWLALSAASAPRRRSGDADRSGRRGRSTADDDPETYGGPGRKQGRGNPRRKSKAEKRREQARADLMRRV